MSQQAANTESSIDALLRPHVRTLVPYSTARDEFTGEAQIFLDANENPYPSPVNRYPDPHQRELKAVLAKRLELSPEQIFVGNGSDEAIDLLVRAFAAPGDRIVVMPPTYGMYAVAARSHDVEVLPVPLGEGFLPDEDAIERAHTSNDKLLFVCSPNNPTGNLIAPDTIERLAARFPGIVVVDEAYIDFSDGPSALTLLSGNERLVILRTLSKAWGIAGARVGIALGHRSMIRALDTLKAPYNVNSLSQRCALDRLAAAGEVLSQLAELKRERTRMAAELKKLDSVVHVFPSDANFLLVRFRESGRLFRGLQAQGIIVRDRAREPGCDGCLRISLGTPGENTRLLTALEELQ